MWLFLHTHIGAHTLQTHTHRGGPEAEQINKTHTLLSDNVYEGRRARMWDSLNDLGQESLPSSQYYNEFHYVHFLPGDPVPQRLLCNWMTLVL